VADGSRSQLAAYAVAAVLVVVAGVKLLSPGHRGASAAPPIRVDRGAARDDSAGAGAYVHVAGAVRRPGLYRLPRSARIAAAIRRAGGPTRRADLSAVNLAARVEDGRQILVPRAGAAAGAASSGGGSVPPAGVQISLASATVEQLDGLDGIGPTLAKRIVEYRTAHGGFRSIDELAQVEGIGDKRLAALRHGLRP
jgi:competence protein ComEA